MCTYIVYSSSWTFQHTRKNNHTLYWQRQKENTKYFYPCQTQMHLKSNNLLSWSATVKLLTIHTLLQNVNMQNTDNLNIQNSDMKAKAITNHYSQELFIRYRVLREGWLESLLSYFLNDDLLNFHKYWKIVLTIQLN